MEEKVAQNVANEEIKMEEKVAQNVANEESATPVNNSLIVYKKKSTFKGATDEDFWYSATRSDGSSVICKFKCDIKTDSMAFEISNVIGNFKKKEAEVKGETYINYTYYIDSCDFHEIKGKVLPL